MCSVDLDEDAFGCFAPEFFCRFFEVEQIAVWARISFDAHARDAIHFR
jgi:hypothetical protein